MRMERLAHRIPRIPASPFPQHYDHGNFNLNLKSAVTNSNSAPLIGGPEKSTGSTGGLTERQKVYNFGNVLTSRSFLFTQF